MGYMSHVQTGKLTRPLELALRYKMLMELQLVTHFNEHNPPYIFHLQHWNRDAIQSCYASSHSTSFGYAQKELLNITLPERNGDWVCEVLPTIDRIVSKGTFDTWKININIGDSIVPIDYIHDSEPRLLFHKSAIDGCTSSERAYLQGIIRASANENPKSYYHLNYLYTELFGKRLTGVKRTSNQSSGSVKIKSPKRSGSIVGTYQCKHNGQMAYMRICETGVFSLKLELEAGSAQGLCKNSSCTIESINSNAVAFTNSVNSFAVKRTGNTCNQWKCPL